MTPDTFVFSIILLKRLTPGVGEAQRFRLGVARVFLRSKHIRPSGYSGFAADFYFHASLAPQATERMLV